MLNACRFVPVLLLLWLPSVAAAPESQNDIKLIIDVSGSMKKNDPDDLRRPAMNLLMNLLPADGRAGVWLFGDQVEPLVPFGPVSTEFKAQAVQRSQLIHSRGLLTDIGAALDASMLSSHVGGKAILLSDGMVDIGPDQARNQRERERIENEVIPALQTAGAEVHTVALSTNADSEILEAIAQGTGGLFEVATNADDLTRIFLRLFDDAVIQDRLPLNEGRFLVDSAVEEFTVLTFRAPDAVPIQIKSPADEYFLATDHPPSVKWYQDKGFELITVTRPLEGQWRLFSDEDPQNRVTILSDLKLDVTNLDNVMHEASFPVLEARFLQEQTLIDDEDFLQHMDVQLIVTTPAGKRIAKPLETPVEGVYATELGVFAEPGRYRIAVNVDGKSFRREVVQEVQYGSPAKVVFSEPDRLVTVRPVAAGLLGEEVKLVARLEDATDKKRLLPLVANEGLWELSLADLPAGAYELTIYVKGKARTGQSLDFVLGKLSVTLEPPDTSEAPVEDAEGWSIAQWALAVSILLGNLVIAGLGVWYYRRRKADVGEDEEGEDKEVADLLKSSQSAGVDTAEKPADEEATSSAELAEDSGSDSKADQDANADMEDTSVGDMADIVDAWDSGDEFLDDEEKAEEDGESASDSPELDSGEAAESDEDLMEEFQTAVDEQLEDADDSGEPQDDENAKTVVLDDPIEDPDAREEDEDEQSAEKADEDDEEDSEEHNEEDNEDNQKPGTASSS